MYLFIWAVLVSVAARGAFLELQWAGPLFAAVHGLSRVGSVVAAHGFGCFLACATCPNQGSTRRRVPCIGTQIPTTGTIRKSLLLLFEYSFCDCPPLCLLVISSSFQSITWVFLVDSSAIYKYDFCLFDNIDTTFLFLALYYWPEHQEQQMIMAVAYILIWFPASERMFSVFCSQG